MSFSTTGMFQQETIAIHCLTGGCSGVMDSPIDHVTKQGYDLQFGTNVIGASTIASTLYPRPR